MVDNVAIELALRARLLTLSVATTASTSLAASSVGGVGSASAFTRVAGSFVTDGLAVGMEVTPSGFTAPNNGVTTITNVTDLVCTVDVPLIDDPAVAGRSLAVGLPSTVSFDNVSVQTMSGKPWIDQDYLPGPSTLQTTGPSGTIELRPTYVVRVYVAADTGISAASRYGDAILALFAPKTAIAIGSDTLRVRGDTAPWAGQLLPQPPGFSVKTLTIPLRITTINSL